MTKKIISPPPRIPFTATVFRPRIDGFDQLPGLQHRFAVENHARLRQKQFPLLRQPDAMRRAAQEVHAKFLLQIGHLTAQRWLRQSKARCGFGEIQRLRHGQKISEMTQFHRAEDGANRA
jgi:hypothetical protein